jgi:hypothetical protein
MHVLRSNFHARRGYLVCGLFPKRNSVAETKVAYTVDGIKLDGCDATVGAIRELIGTRKAKHR